MRWDTTVSIEGVATAAGVVGAAVGYLVNLIRNWRQEAKNKKRRGTYSTILHLLEEDLVSGLTEDQLWDMYSSERTSEVRRRYNALTPTKVDRVRFESLIRDLRLDRLIELVGRDQYRLETRHLDKYDFQSEARAVAIKAANRAIAPTAVADAARAALLDESLDRWERKHALELLMRVDPDDGVAQATKLLSCGKHDLIIMAGEVLADLQKPKRP
jgi:hypothetical protein